MAKLFEVQTTLWSKTPEEYFPEFSYTAASCKKEINTFLEKTSTKILTEHHDYSCPELYSRKIPKTAEAPSCEVVVFYQEPKYGQKDFFSVMLRDNKVHTKRYYEKLYTCGDATRSILMNTPVLDTFGVGTFFNDKTGKVEYDVYYLPEDVNKALSYLNKKWDFTEKLILPSKNTTYLLGVKYDADDLLQVKLYTYPHAVLKGNRLWNSH